MLPKGLVVALFVILPACGALGLYLSMPGGRRGNARRRLVRLAAAAAALLMLVIPQLAAGPTRGWFIALAIIGILAAVRMITHQRPVYSALYFILVVLSVAGLLVLMQAGFLAAALLIIYAGAILVIYVFVIMLARQTTPAPCDRQAHEPFFGCLAGFVLLSVVVCRLLLAPETGQSAPPLSAVGEGTPLNIGTRLLTNYVIVIELVGVLLLAALVGAIAIARRKTDQDALEETD